MNREQDDNSEQDDGDQAQDVAADALTRTARSGGSERGGHAGRTEVAPADEPDLVERMEGMIRSGVIDNDAYVGEPQMDDEEDNLGPTDDEEED